MIEILERVSSTINRILLWVGCAVLLAMVGLACSNMFLRAVWVPVKGTFELMGFAGALVAALALGVTQENKGHIAVTVLLGKLPRWLEKFFDAASNLICALFFAMAAREVVRLGTFLVSMGELSETLRFAYHPFVFAVALGCAAMSLSLLVAFLRDLFPRKEAQS